MLAQFHLLSGQYITSNTSQVTTDNITRTFLTKNPSEVMAAGKSTNNMHPGDVMLDGGGSVYTQVNALMDDGKSIIMVTAMGKVKTNPLS